MVDDAQWLDRASAQALAFVARHLAAAPAAVIFAVRQPGCAVLIGTPAALDRFWSGLMARIVTSWPDRLWPAGRGTAGDFHGRDGPAPGARLRPVPARR
jgi:hypothetical protein